MELTQSKLIELLCTALVFLALFSSGIHAKDVVATRHLKTDKDDTTSIARKIASDWHNHIDKFSVKNMKFVTTNPFGADNRSLKKQFVSNKRLQKLLD